MDILILISELSTDYRSLNRPERGIRASYCLSLLRHLHFRNRDGEIFDYPTLCSLATLFLWASAADDDVLDFEKATFPSLCLQMFEEILPLIRYHPALWCQAALLHFKQHQAAAMKRGEDLLVTLGDLTYGRVTWASLRHWKEARDPTGDNAVSVPDTTDGQTSKYRIFVGGTPLEVTHLMMSREAEQLVSPLSQEVMEGGNVNLVSGFICLFWCRSIISSRRYVHANSL
jgi:hypothetical protein